MEPALEVDSLVKEFAGRRALDGLSLRVPSGRTFGLIGPNGAGKTTLIRVLAGLTRPTAGRVRVLGRAPTAARSLVGYMTQAEALYQDLTVRENLEFFASVHGLAGEERRRRVEEVLRLVELEDRAGSPVFTLSGGMRQRASLACALVHRPRLLLLDEPTVGVDPELRAAFWDYFARLNAEGVTILVSTHHLEEARRCHRLALLRDGVLLAEGAPADLMREAGADTLEETFLHFAGRRAAAGAGSRRTAEGGEDPAGEQGAAGGDAARGLAARVLAVSTRILRQFRRDRRTLFLVFFVPVLVMTLLTVLTNVQTRPRVGVVAGVAGPGSATQAVPQALAGQLAAELGRDGSVQLADLEGRQPEAAVQGRFVDAVVVVEPARLRVIVEGAEPQVTGATLAALRRALERQGPPVQVRYVHGGAELRPIDYHAPAFVPLFVFLYSFLLTAVSFLRERTQGTMERLLASPLSAVEILLGYLGGFFAFALAEALIVLAFTVYGLGIELRGGFGPVFVVVAVLTVVAVNLGIFLSAYARNELQAVQFIPLVVLPQALLGDFVFRVADMPAPLRALAEALPLTYASRALREVVIRGGGLDRIGPELAALGVFAAGSLVLGVLSLRRAGTA